MASEKGAVLVLVLMIAVVGAILSVALSLGAVNEKNLTQRQLDSAKAFWAAEAGIHAAYWEMTRNDCQAMRILGTQTYCSSCKDCAAKAGYLTGTLATGMYRVLLSSSNSLLKSTGYFPDIDTVRAERSIRAELGKGVLFGYAAFAREDLDGSGNGHIYIDGPPLEADAPDTFPNVRGWQEI